MATSDLLCPCEILTNTYWGSHGTRLGLLSTDTNSDPTAGGLCLSPPRALLTACAKRQESGEERQEGRGDERGHGEGVGGNEYGQITL